jgi:hypothetical protein
MVQKEKILIIKISYLGLIKFLKSAKTIKLHSHSREYYVCGVFDGVLELTLTINISVYNSCSSQLSH